MSEVIDISPGNLDFYLSSLRNDSVMENTTQSLFCLSELAYFHFSDIIFVNFSKQFIKKSNIVIHFI